MEIFSLINNFFQEMDHTQILAKNAENKLTNLPNPDKPKTFIVNFSIIF